MKGDPTGGIWLGKMVYKWKNDTSNLKEGKNIIVRVDELSEEHKLDNGELFILEDKQMFEGCF